jgi:hypothetical protein
MLIIVKVPMTLIFLDQLIWDSNVYISKGLMNAFILCTSLF